MPAVSKYFENKGYKIKGNKECGHCNENMPIYLKRDFLRKRFCSRKCLALFFRDKGTLKGIGLPWTEDRKKKQSIMFSGSNHPSWIKDRIKIKDKRNMSEMRWWRKLIFQRDDYICQLCSQRGGKLNADHIKPYSLFPDLRFDLDNGRTLCIDCHKKTDTYGGRIFKLKGELILAC